MFLLLVTVTSFVWLLQVNELEQQRNMFSTSLHHVAIRLFGLT